MRKFLISSVLVAAAFAANPASAQYYRGGGLEARFDRVAQLIERSHERGFLNNRDARYWQRELNQTERLARQWSRDGLSGRERSVIATRLDHIQGKVRYASQYGRRDARYDRWEDRRDRWDD